MVVVVSVSGKRLVVGLVGGCSGWVYGFSGERVSKRRSDFFLVFRWAEARREEARGKREAV